MLLGCLEISWGVGVGQSDPGRHEASRHRWVTLTDSKAHKVVGNSQGPTPDLPDGGGQTHPTQGTTAGARTENSRAWREKARTPREERADRPGADSSPDV